MLLCLPCLALLALPYLLCPALLLLYCCFTAALLALRYAQAVKQQYACFTAALLLLYCSLLAGEVCAHPRRTSLEPPAALLLLYCCFTARFSQEKYVRIQGELNYMDYTPLAGMSGLKIYSGMRP
jgi:hypothetical protein